MSILVMARVWQNYPGSGGSELLTLLALADWSDDEGRCWPSMAAIAAKARLSRSQAQRVVHGLIADGYLHVLGNADGGRPGSTRQYQIDLESLTGRADAAPANHSGNAETGSTDATPMGRRMDATGSSHATGSTDAAEGPHGCGGTGRADAAQTISEPSTTVRAREQVRATPASKIKKQGQTLRQFLETCRASGEKSIPENDPIFDYAEKVGIEHEMLACCWQEFTARYLSANNLQRDWRAHFRNAVRRNWFHLWFLREGEPAGWTTAGEQARRAAA